jgi:hypothetical protein
VKFVSQNCIAEVSVASGRSYADPSNELTLDFVFTDPEGEEKTVPAFWAGENTWRVRYSSAKVGTHRYRSTCSDASNTDLHGQEGTLEVTPYEGADSLLRRGHLQVAADHRHLQHADGTPFFWLGDTWWFGLVKRLTWPGDFKRLTADRVAKGFTLAQIVAGLYPDVYQFDPRGANEAGFPWTEGYKAINPSYFDMMDLRIEWLVRSGIVPCIVGSWGFYFKFAGVEVMKKHWRNLIARYATYPVAWCIAGEAVMSFYGENWGEEYVAQARKGWTEITRYVRSLDPYRNPITVHPTFPDSRAMIEDDSLLDVDMLQTGHSYTSMERTVRTVIECIAKTPPLPVINGEPMYEGIMGTCWHDMQRFCFWTSMLSGSAGHTYGANGIWQMSTAEEPCVAISGSWGDTTWEEAHQLAGSAHMGVGKRLLERYPWWRFRPLFTAVGQERVHPERSRRVSCPTWDDPERISPFAAGIPGAVWVIYLTTDSIETKFWGLKGKSIQIEPGAHYRAYFHNPRTGADKEVGPVEADSSGRWRIPQKPSREDWVLVVEDKGSLGR